MTPHYWHDAQKHLSKADPVMKRLIKAYDGEMLKGRGEAFYTLARSIVGQQISVKAADSVWGKLEACVILRSTKGGGAESPDPALRRCLPQDDILLSPSSILTLSDETLSGCGLSRQKIIYLREIADYFERHAIGAGYFNDHSDEDVIKALTSIKGIGVWTAEMFLMFHLLRPDVLPLLDIGLQKGMMTHYEGFNALLSLPSPLSSPPSPLSSPRKRGSRRPSGRHKTKELDSRFRGNDGEVSAPQKIPKKHLYAAMTEHAKRWQPYRSVATWYLWRSLDPVPVEY